MDTTLTRQAQRDLARGLSAESARWLVDYYYAVQDFRIQAQGETRAISQKTDEGTFEIGHWLVDETTELEKTIKSALNAYSLAQVPGQWAQSIIGIGPVISAGLLAHIDITKAPTVGHIWRFAGLDPTSKWEKGQKRPWNASLKVLCWKIGESFVKQQNNKNDTYGKVFVARKQLEEQRNEAGLFADQAAEILKAKKFRDNDTRKAYEAGRLPKAHIHARSKRYATKLFLAHYHHVAYESTFNEAPPKPYILTHDNHTHYIAPPNWPL